MVLCVVCCVLCVVLLCLVVCCVCVCVSMCLCVCLSVWGVSFGVVGEVWLWVLAALSAGKERIPEAESCQRRVGAGVR